MTVTEMQLGGDAFFDLSNSPPHLNEVPNASATKPFPRVTLASFLIASSLLVLLLLSYSGSNVVQLARNMEWVGGGVPCLASLPLAI